MDCKDIIPSRELLKAVRAKLVLQDLSFAAYCRAKNLTRQNARSALSGDWTGPKATALVKMIIADLDFDT